MRIRNSVVFLILFLIFVLSIFKTNLDIESNTNKLVKNINESAVFGNATILQVKYVYKRGTSVKFRFIANNDELINGSNNSLSYTDNYYNLITSRVLNKSFPIIYNSKNPSKFYKILLDESDFKAFNIEYPDTLRKYFRN